MSKQKYYYAVVDQKTGELADPIDGEMLLYNDKSKASIWNLSYDIIPIPTEEIDKLIKQYRK